MLPVKVDSKQGLITWNFAEIKKDLEQRLEKYDNVVIDFDDIDEYTRTRANLNKVSKVFDDERKRIKKVYSEPLVAFEKEIKELVGMVKDVSDKIDLQLKDYEEERKQEKKAIILQYVDALNVEHNTDVDVEKHFNDRWLNKTYTQEQWQSDIQAIFFNLTLPKIVGKFVIEIECTQEQLSNLKTLLTTNTESWRFKEL